MSKARKFSLAYPLVCWYIIVALNFLELTQPARHRPALSFVGLFRGVELPKDEPLRLVIGRQRRKLGPAVSGSLPNLAIVSECVIPKLSKRDLDGEIPELECV